MYQVISRRYRPQTFASVVGQDVLVATLKQAVKSGRIAHAYLFCGLKGTGKTTCARLLAKALNCKALVEGCEPCGLCVSCKEISSGSSLDVLEIDGASHRGIDSIRQLNDTVGYAPHAGRYKVYIIDEVHMLTKEAFNALLKTLEEPPSHVKFIFATTEPHKIPSTILSRCQRFDLSRIAPLAMREKLRFIISDAGMDMEDAALDLVIQRAEGSLRDAESLLDQILCSHNQSAIITAERATALLGIPPQHLFEELDQAVYREDLAFAFTLTERLFVSGLDPAYFLESLMEHFRLILVGLLGGSAHPVYTKEDCLYILDFLIGMEKKELPFKRILVEMTLLQIVRSKKRVSIDTLVKKLTELENKAPPLLSQTMLPPEKVVSIEPPAPIEPLRAVPVSSGKEQSAYDTLLRFAAVELEGTLIT